MLLGVSSTATIFASAISAAGGTLAAITAAWYTRRRDAAKQSGTVATSDAGQLWEAFDDLLNTVREERDASKQEVAALTQRLDTVTDSNDGLRLQLEAAQRLVDQLREERIALSEEATRLEQANSHLQRMNAALTDRVAHLTALLEEHDIPTTPHRPRKERP